MEFAALHAVNEWDRREQKARRPITFLAPGLALDEENNGVAAGDDAPGDHLVEPMQLVDFEFEAIAPNRPCAPSEVQQADADMVVPALPLYDPVDRVVQLLLLKEVIAQERGHGPMQHRGRRNDVEPAKPSQGSGYIVAQREREVSLIFRLVVVERKDADTESMSANRRPLNVQIGAVEVG